MASDFAYLIRFLDEEGETCYGNLTEAKTEQDLIGSKVQVVRGNPFTSLKITDEEKTITKVRDFQALLTWFVNTPGFRYSARWR